jgi:hypothetical protein
MNHSPIRDPDAAHRLRSQSGVRLPASHSSLRAQSGAAGSLAQRITARSSSRATSGCGGPLSRRSHPPCASDPQLRSQYEHLKFRGANKARVAIARKLSTIAFQILRDQRLAAARIGRGHKPGIGRQLLRIAESHHLKHPFKTWAKPNNLSKHFASSGHRSGQKVVGTLGCDLTQFRKKFGKANVTSLVERVKPLHGLPAQQRSPFASDHGRLD